MVIIKRKSEQKQSFSLFNEKKVTRQFISMAMHLIQQIILTNILNFKI